MNSKSKRRFTNRVENYAKYRPGYTADLYRFLSESLGMTLDWRICDMGSGTGLSSVGFLENGNAVTGVEPNEAMRQASKRILATYPGFKSVDGSSDETGLDSDIFDAVFAGQSFHWFCNRNSATEIRRILKPGGFVLIAWNERLLDADEFHSEYESLLNRFSYDYEEIRHDSFTGKSLNEVFGADFTLVTFENKQVFDFEGLMGRVLSSSYMPDENAPEFESMRENLESLFAVHQENDRITVFYTTKLYFCKF